MPHQTPQTHGKNISQENQDLFKKDRRTAERRDSIERRTFLRPTNRLRIYGFAASLFIAILIYVAYLFSK